MLAYAGLWTLSVLGGGDIVVGSIFFIYMYFYIILEVQ